jgi:DNA-binding YbaB/EbfC family protein
MGINPRDFQKLQQQMMKAQAKMQEAQEQVAQELAAMTIEGTAGGGAVVITLSGDQQPKAVKIDPEAVDPDDVAALEDLILVALTDGLEKVSQVQSEAQQRITNAAMGGIKLPPGFGF